MPNCSERFPMVHHLDTYCDLPQAHTGPHRSRISYSGLDQFDPVTGRRGHDLPWTRISIYWHRSDEPVYP